MPMPRPSFAGKTGEDKVKCIDTTVCTSGVIKSWGAGENAEILSTLGCWAEISR